MMDERQAQIKEGEGLQESRVNEEFVAFLRKWSQPVLLLIVILSLGWMAWNRYQEAQAAKRDAAFAALAVSVENADVPSPASLRAVSEDYAGVGSVSLIADLRLADLYLESARRGLDIGAELDDEGQPSDPEAVLSEADREAYYADAERAYRAVLASTEGSGTTALIAINAAFGLAAVAESRGDREAAATMYDKVISLARASGMRGLDTVAENRKADLDTLSEPRTLLAMEDLPLLPGQEPPAEDAADEAAAETSGETAGETANGASEATGSGGDGAGSEPGPEADPAGTAGAGDGDG